MVSSDTGAARLPLGVRLRDLPQHADDRGFLVELTSTTLGDDARPAQWTVLQSTANTVRGMHVHVRHTDWITVVGGVAMLGLVDLRSGSMDDAARATVSMRAISPQVLTIPPGVLHGIFTPESSVILNGLSHEFDAADDHAACYDDPHLGLAWDVHEPVLSARDRAAPSVADLLARLADDGVVWPACDA